jgi:hypothetical protein
MSILVKVPQSTKQGVLPQHDNSTCFLRHKIIMYRPDLTEYEPFIDMLAEKLNEDALFRMSKTDAVKIAIEKALQNLVPDVVVNKKRKTYQILEF